MARNKKSWWQFGNRSNDEDNKYEMVTVAEPEVRDSVRSQDSGMKRKLALSKPCNHKKENKEEAFAFLDEAVEAKYNWTTAESLPMVPAVVTKFLSSKEASAELSHYAKSNDGEPYLKRAVADHFKDRGLTEACAINSVIDNSSFTILGSFYRVWKEEDVRGGQESMRLKEEDKALLVIPCFGFFYDQLKDNNITIELFDTKDDDWKINPQKLRTCLENDPNIKILIITDPNNPLGTIMTEKEVKAIARVLRDFPYVRLVVDEVFGNMSLGKKKSYSFGNVADPEKIFILQSLGKECGITSVRLSMAYAPEHTARRYPHASNHPDGMSSLSQGIVAAILTSDNKEYLDRSRLIYLNNIACLKVEIDNLNQALNKHLGTEGCIYVKTFMKEIQAGNVCLLDFSGLKGMSVVVEGVKKLLTTGLDIAKLLLSRGVAMVPGECSYMRPELMTVRTSLYVGKKELQPGFKRIIDAFITQELEGIPNSSVHLRGNLSSLGSRDNRDSRGDSDDRRLTVGSSSSYFGSLLGNKTGNKTDGRGGRSI